jgi:hypothetical protein
MPLEIGQLPGAGLVSRQAGLKHIKDRIYGCTYVKLKRGSSHNEKA